MYFSIMSRLYCSITFDLKIATKSVLSRNYLNVQTHITNDTPETNSTIITIITLCTDQKLHCQIRLLRFLLS